MIKFENEQLEKYLISWGFIHLLEKYIKKYLGTGVDK